MSLSAIRNFLRLEVAGGFFLVASATVALILANSPAQSGYQALLHLPLGVQFSGINLSKSALHWINDGLMAVFFLLVGLEIKREAIQGELSSLRRAALPILAALGGMAVPALVYLGFTWGDPVMMRGWAISSATDIAFAVGVLALAGRRAPPSLRIFLLALAIIDDLGAIVIIALFYTDQISLMFLALALATLIGLVAMNQAGVTRLAPYLGLGLLLWFFVLESGIHATLAGVALGLTIPLRQPAASIKAPPLLRLEHGLHPWVTFAILPLFAFANAGVPLTDADAAVLSHPVTLGVALGLFLGKQAGIMLAIGLGLALKIGTLPAGANLRQLYAMAILTGIGFTMSLFIGTLAFEDVAYDVPVRLGVLGGSLLSAAVGFTLLMAGSKRRE
ncbi:Na+/H+ antiporter NhaA [Magnetospirillum molischianum]|uniref:Na(+)/H(+) antiporter NhaA n=1 Tax=Magnetospirillum molischianum DSM 120 TaxID=1150626 RepID=H8FXE2_MAGML|nr:Na+/H+ antiporter NhaA [Magnetospirillum molischianum]CCG43030.1 Na(+)/H(+) antiporter nhaA [Magnetospirillum molischianum DSM 120]